MSLQRLETRLKNPNAIFESCLEGWLSEAENKRCKSQHKLREALDSLKKYPLPLASGKDCAILRGFGKKLCSLIDNEMKKEKRKARPFVLNSGFYDKGVHQLINSIKRDKEMVVSANEIPKKCTKKQLKVLAEEAERLKEVRMSPGSFKILLLVDTQETNGKNKKALGHTQSCLESLSVEYEVRRLTIGDFIWVARDQEGNELVLPYIIERKRMDDLASSIKDGRLHEQEHRLKHSGIQHVIYLIEDYGDNDHLGLPLDNLNQALMNILIHKKFSIQHTENHRRSMIYLQSVGLLLMRLYKKKILFSCEKKDLQIIDHTQKMIGLLKFKTLYDDSARNAQLTIREVFVQQLLQLHSLSLEKALAIVSLYPTPLCLLEAYDECKSVDEARNLLVSLKYGEYERVLGTKISQLIHNFYRSSF